MVLTFRPEDSKTENVDSVVQGQRHISRSPTSPLRVRREAPAHQLNRTLHVPLHAFVTANELHHSRLYVVEMASQVLGFEIHGHYSVLHIRENVRSNLSSLARSA